MKDETCDASIKGLKSKLCAFITNDNHHESKKAKSINKNVDDEVKYEDYKSVFFSRSYMKHEIKRNRGKDHNIGSYRINKIYLSPYDDKKNIYLRIRCQWMDVCSLTN